MTPSTKSPAESCAARDRFSHLLGMELVSAGAGSAAARMRVGAKHHNGVASAHGGAIFGLADFAFAMASNSHGTIAVAIQCSITYMKAVSEGMLLAEAREVSCNKKLGTYEVTITDESGDLVARFQGLAYRKSHPVPLEPSR